MNIFRLDAVTSLTIRRFAGLIHELALGSSKRRFFSSAETDFPNQDIHQPNSFNGVFVIEIILLAQQAPGAASCANAALMPLMIVAVFYFIMIRPQQKEQRRLQEFRDALKVGDRVITAGGIHGRVTEVGDTWIKLEVTQKTQIKFEKSQIAMPVRDELLEK